MVLIYIKLAVRLLIRNPLFSLVNILGLSIGFAVFFSLWQYSTTELQTDRHHEDFERIVRVGMRQSSTDPGNGERLTMGPSKASLPPQFKADFPEVESYVRVCEQGGFFQEDLFNAHGVRMVIAHTSGTGERKIFKETKAAYADRNFFEFFTVPMIHGNGKTALSGVNFVALSQTLSEKYFGKENPIGEILSLNDSITLKVAGVFKDFPHNSRLFYDMVISNDGLLTKWSNVYWGGTQNFVKLKAGSSRADFEEKLNSQKIKQKYWGSDLITCKCERELFVQPLTDITFSNRYVGDEGIYKSKTILITLAIISVIVLMMAWINYINLSLTAMASRMKEFATRRVNGATAMDLIKQFLTESVIINVLAVGVALTILQLARKPLEVIFEIYIAEIWSTKLEVWQALLATLLGGILITGIYPAYVCISRQPRLLLMMKSGTNSKSFVKSMLTTVQFTVAITLISWVFIVYLQLNYILKKDIGLNQKGVIIVDGPIVKPNQFEQVFETFVQQLSDLPGVDQATSSRYMVGDEGDKPGNLKLIGGGRESGGNANGVSEVFIPFFGLNMLAGRNFVKNDRPDVIIIAQVIAQRLGFNSPADAIGAKVQVNTGNWHILKNAEIIGVVQDYHTTPYFNYTDINTMMMEGGFGLFLTYNNKLFAELTPENIAIRVDVRDADRVLPEVTKLYSRLFPGNAFEWRFLNDQITRVYGSEKVARNQILMFTLLAIGIACLGLVAMMTQRIFEKTKEVGIRKVLGASVFELVRTLVRSTSIQFVIAAALGIPLSSYLGDQYLQRYSERIALGWWHYLLPICILFFIMSCTVANMLWKALRSNPVDSLKHE